MPAFPAEADALRRDLLARLDSIRDVLEAGSAAGEDLRTLPPASVEALTESGLFRFKAPRETGGAEADPLVQMDLIEAATAVDPAAGWCLFICASVAAMAASRLPDEGLGELMAAGRLPRMAGSLLPGGRATAVPGGYRISGRWRWSSGINHAEWVSALCLGPGDGGPPLVAAVVPRAEVVVHDTWFTMGMRGTGSADYEVVDAFVPRHRVMFAPLRGGALFRLGMPAFVLNEHAAFALGIARRSLETIVELAASKSRGYFTARTLAEREVFQRVVGLSDVRLASARAAIHHAYGEVWARVRDGGEPTDADRTRLRATAAFVNDEALDVVSQAFRFGSGTAVFSDSVLQRGLRDLQTASAHLMIGDGAYEQHGNLVLGRPVDASIAGMT